MITTDDLIHPDGEIDPASLFADYAVAQVTDWLDTWIARGYALLGASAVPVDQYDQGAKAYAYMRAYTKKVDDLAASPTSSSLTDAGVSESYSTERDKVWQRKAAFWTAEWNRVQSLGYPTAITPPLPTTPVKTEFSW